MKTTKVLLSGVVFTFAAFAASGDQFAEERYRVKYGRYTPAEETGKKAAAVQVAAYVAGFTELGRCPLTRLGKTEARSYTIAGNLTDSETRRQAKYGQTLSAEERRKTTPTASGEKPLVAATEHSICTEACCTHGE